MLFGDHFNPQIQVQEILWLYESLPNLNRLLDFHLLVVFVNFECLLVNFIEVGSVLLITHEFNFSVEGLVELVDS